MKNAKPRKTKRAVPVAVVSPGSNAAASSGYLGYWPYAAALFVALFAMLEVYWPAVRGPFVMDDTYLPYGIDTYGDVPLSGWLRGVRPVLMFSFWLNFQDVANQDTFPYHFVNFILHFLNGLLIFLAVRKVMSWASVESRLREVFSVFAAGLFLFHPLQTESVSYIASRSETLGVFWLLAAFVIFLYRPGNTVFALRAIAILALFALAVLTKEHTAVLPALLLLTDYFWNPGFSFVGIRRNGRLYVPLLIAGAAGLALVWRTLKGANSAGFGLGFFTWYQYFFTECRAVWDYLRLFLFPLGQNFDTDFPISHTLIDHGALFGLIGLIATTALAWIYRRRFPLASYGWLTFLILLAPTSSFVPIKDPFAERRLYLPFIGLLFIAVEFLRRWKTTRNTMIATLSLVLVAEAALAYQRNQLWSNAIDLWKDTVSKSPNAVRPRFQLAFSYYAASACSESADEFQRAADLAPPTYDLLLDWALAYDCVGKPEIAIAKLQQAALLVKSAHVYQQLGNEYGRMGRYPEALDALATAVKLDPKFSMTYFTRGNVYLSEGNKPQAAEDYRHALRLDPRNELARSGLAKTGQ
jgi:Tfp pilus assembly protein PilF